MPVVPPAPDSSPATGRPAAPAPRRRGPFFAVAAMCWLLVMFDGLDVSLYGAALPGMLDDPGLGLDAAQAGAIGSYATFGMLVGALTAGTLTDLLGRKRMLLWCVTVFSVASGLCAIAPSAEFFGLARLLAGVGLGGLLPSALALVSDFAPRGRGSLAIAVSMTAYHVGAVFATLASLAVLDSWGWRGVFWIGVLPCVVAVPLMARYLPESTSFLLAKGRRAEAEAVAARHGIVLDEEDVRRATAAAGTAGTGRATALRVLFGRGYRTTTLAFWLASFAGLLLVYGVNTWLPTLMRASGYAVGSSLVFLLVINLGGVVGMLVAGPVADRYGARRVSAIWFLLTALGTYALSVRMPLALSLVLVFLTGVVLFSAQTMVYAFVSERYGPDSRATALGWTAGMGRFGAVLGPWLGGQLLAAELAGWSFQMFAAAGVLGAVMTALVPGARAGAVAGGAPAAGGAVAPAAPAEG
ncbi:MFS transporter [Allostreptomyces psammosilenae]|uniref:AAHS family benzoate transporter-like MFS transporter n=1 Tax=Allostreptomyces psammosilenae TaxID=1892865 RepID=A0A853A0Y1_9ACTN|nr:aromatic acid/H+ symport family MFS transporter [Allostreptomyces psammosilenae]NYI04471.1 AAHS family benzoate transporter-like MFS transporter [Allostreptomyces psammosilenae]